MVPWGDPQALSMLQRKLDVDILITGHTHEYKVPPTPDDYGVNVLKMN